MKQAFNELRAALISLWEMMLDHWPFSWLDMIEREYPRLWLMVVAAEIALFLTIIIDMLE